MIIFPAIDLYQKKAVRLYKGNYDDMTVYHDHPLEVAREMEALGATAVHLVDLEGARSGDTPNLEVAEQIVRQTGLFTEIGGGIRDMETVNRVLSIGVSRVILGTAAVECPDFLEEAIKRYGDQIAVGADVKDGAVAIRGWLEQSRYSLDSFLDRMQSCGVRTIICTDISRDGAMRGTNLELYSLLSRKYSMQITASGGVSTLDDVKKLSALGLYGAIIGKAYYTGDIDLKEAIEAAK